MFLKGPFEYSVQSMLQVPVGRMKAIRLPFHAGKAALSDALGGPCGAHHLLIKPALFHALGSFLFSSTKFHITKLKKK